ncbi:putative O-glycosylation ligase, exosortase A system-associated [Thauera sp.]|uniref:putative O-glycosylation ligase, exosortase A system-associated n=1 Tax=Thauera sp. TaxID=1905334 RepID=UPI0039E59959
MRDLLILGILGTTVPYVFRYAFIGVLLWTWIGIMNPHRLAYGFMHSAPIALVVALVTFIGLFTTRDRVKFDWSAPMVVLAIFVVWMGLTTVFAFFPGESLSQLIKVLKIQIMIFIAAAVLYKHMHIRLFIWINVLSLGFYGLKGGLYTISTGGGGRVWGPPGGFVEGNNELGLALILTIPLMHFLRVTSPHKWVKRGLLVLMMLSAVSAIGTQSRGAMLAISGMAVVLWWRAPNKMINAFMLSLVGLVILAMMPESWYERMGTIQTYENDGSAMGRINAWITMVNVANDRFFGGGFDVQNPFVFGLYAPDPSNPLTAHSIYFQVLGEHGYVGLGLFLLVWLLAWRRAAALRRGTRDDPELGWLYHLGSMVQVSLVGYAIGGAFLSLAYFDLPYNILVALVVATRWRGEHAMVDEYSTELAARPAANTPLRMRFLWWIRTA